MDFDEGQPMAYYYGLGTREDAIQLADQDMAEEEEERQKRILALTMDDSGEPFVWSSGGVSPERRQRLETALLQPPARRVLLSVDPGKENTTIVIMINFKGETAVHIMEAVVMATYLNRRIQDRNAAQLREEIMRLVGIWEVDTFLVEHQFKELALRTVEARILGMGDVLLQQGTLRDNVVVPSGQVKKHFKTDSKKYSADGKSNYRLNKRLAERKAVEMYELLNGSSLNLTRFGLGADKLNHVADAYLQGLWYIDQHREAGDLFVD